MFEQPLYETRPVATPPQDGDLFHNYEIKNWEMSPRLYKILGAAAVANLLALFVFAQTSLLTTKGCDSPLVGRVCQVLDTVYVASTIFGTEREYIDAVYDKTDLNDSDITYVDVTGVSPPLSYPAGYFQIANPDQLAMLDSVDDLAGFPSGIPGIPGKMPITPSSGGSLLDTNPTLPPANPNSVDGDLPPGFGGANPTVNPPIARIKRPRRPRTTPQTNGANPIGTPTGTPDPNQVAEAKPSPTPVPDTPPAATDEAKEDKFGRFINKRPLTDRAKETVAKVEANEVKLDAKFKVTISGTLGLSKDGKMVLLKNPKQIVDKTVKNDPAMEKLAQDWILAVGDAGWLAYIESAEALKTSKAKRNILFTIEQNGTDFLATIKAEQADENMAKTMASGLGTLLGLAAPATDGDEQVFLRSASSTSDGKSLVLNIRLPTPQFQEMIQRKLAEEKAKLKQPNGNAIINPRDNSAQK